MIPISCAPPRLERGSTRRELLRLGAIAGTGLSLPQLFADEKRRSNPRRGGKAKSCILFFLHGGQSQLDTFDMKPQAPEAIRGPFRPIATPIPGFQICEYLPLLAKSARDYAVFRTMSHKSSNHNPGTYYALTGVPPARDITTLTTGPDDHPNPGSVLSKFAPVDKPVPTFVQFSPPVVGDALTQVGGQNAGFLGSQYDPLKISADPAEATFNIEELTLPEQVSAKRFERRRNLLKTVESEFALLRESPELGRMDRFYQRAYELVTSPESRRAFDLQQEPEKLRDRYGRNTYGQSLLLARRLVEAGVRLVTVYWGGLINFTDDYWDTHKNNFPKQKEKLLPTFDQCFSALLDDLKDRGLYDSTLVLAMGEFGRTPRIGQVTVNNGTDATGRDHWPACYHILAAGGGVVGGAILGKSDANAAYPLERPAAPEDLIATIYYALGVDYEMEVHDRLNRPLPVTRGTPITDLFAG